jgi:hypothetical protein
LQPVLIEYVTRLLIEQVCQEILAGQVRLLNQQALLKASAQDYVREIQRRLLLAPVADWTPIDIIQEFNRITEAFRRESVQQDSAYLPADIRALLKNFQETLARLTDTQDSLEQQLLGLLAHLRAQPPHTPGYAAGNILNLLCLLKQNDLADCDCARLNIRQADLQHANLRRVNAAHANFEQVLFAEVFSGIIALAYSPCGSLLAAGSTNGQIRVWRLADWKQVAVLTGHQDWVRALAFSPDGTRLVSASDDETLCVWDARAGQRVMTLRGHAGRVLATAWNPAGTRLASGGEDALIRLWDANSGELVESWQPAPWWWVMALAFHPVEPSLLVSHHGDGVIRVWDLTDGCQIAVFTGHQGPIRAIAFHPEGGFLASTGHDGVVKIWDIQAAACVKTLEGHVEAVWALTITHDGRWIVTGGSDDVLKVWDWHTGVCVQNLDAPGPYEGFNITGATGLTPAQKATLKALGACDDGDLPGPAGEFS